MMEDLSSEKDGISEGPFVEGKSVFLQRECCERSLLPSQLHSELEVGREVLSVY